MRPSGSLPYSLLMNAETLVATARSVLQIGTLDDRVALLHKRTHHVVKQSVMIVFGAVSGRARAAADRRGMSAG